MPAPLGAKVLAGLCLLVAACEGQPKPKPAPSASAAATVDVAAYCNAACARASRCGLEDAEKLVRATPDEQVRWAQMQTEAQANEAACEQECAAGSADASAAGPMREIERCLEQTSCETFRSCLARDPDAPSAAEARR